MSSNNTASSSTQQPKIAVVGMAVKYAGAKNKDEFWKTLNERTLNTKPITAERLGTNDKDFHMSKVRSKFADKFNNDRYGTIDGSPKDEHELLLQLARDALKDGGFDSLNSSPENSSDEDGLRRCGIVSGCLSFPRDSLQKEFHDKIYQEHFENYMGDILDPTKILSSDNESSEDKFEMDPASFVASKLKLGGTHYSLDAACASALYVLKVASDHLLSGRCDMMLAGASTFPEPFFILTGFSTFQALPLGGDKSVPLDKDSKGLTPGEGGAIMVLKRYEDAVRDGDKIYGSLLGVGVSNAGAGLPLKPHPPSQIACLKDTYKKIGVSPSTVQYVECHATGTVQGDIAEVEAMKTCFGKNNCPRYGSTKGNFGHTLVSAGFAGMCKVLLSMQNGVIPGTPGIEKPVDDKLVRENTPWPKCELKRAGLSAFGFGGTNAHAVFEEYKGSSNGGSNVPTTPTRRTNNNSNNRASLSGLDVSVSGTSDKKLNGKTVTVYEITVKRGNEVISKLEKRFSEFQGLRDALNQQSSGSNSPSRQRRSRFPSSGGLNGFLFGRDPAMVEQRRNELESYIRDVIANATSSQTGLICTFLSLNTSISSPLISSPSSSNGVGLKPLAELAIVGMEATFGTLSNLTEFERAVFEGKDGACDLPDKRWRFLNNDENFLGKIGLSDKPRGCFIDAVDVDFSRIRTPLTKEDQLIPQQLLAISVMDKALQDAGMSKGGNVAVLVGLGTDLELYRHRERLSLIEQLDSQIDANKLRDATDYINNAGTSTSYVSFIGNLVATRLSSSWGFTGPSFTITEGENSVLRCVEVGRQMLSTGEVDAVVVAGVDLCGSAESFYVKSKQCNLSKSDAPFAPFEHRADGLFVGEGAGALVLKRLSDCSPSRNKQGAGRIYATIKGVGTGVNTTVSSQMALMEAGVADDAVEYIEVATPSLTPGTNGVEIADLSTVYKGKKSSVRQYAVGCVQANVGYVGYATGVASLIKTALCLYNRYLPVTPRWEKPSTNAAWEKSAFYVCPDSRAWMKNPGERRLAGVNGVSAGGSHFHIVMSDLEGQNERENIMSEPDDAVKLISIVGRSTNDVVNKIMQIQKEFVQTIDGKNYMRTLLQKSLDTTPTKADFVVGIVANYLTLSDELTKAAKGIARANKAGRDWASPAGSFYTPNPIRSDKIAFMYGDGASPYCGLGRDMYRIFPSMHEVVHDKTTEMWSTSDEAWNTREVLQSQMKHAEEKFVHRTVDMFRSGVFHSTMFTSIARDILGIKPKAAFGLSMGEVATLFAFSNANSSKSDEMTRRLNASPVWTSELAVEYNALRKAWGIASNVPVSEFWRGYLLHAPRSKVEPIVQNNKFVRMVIVNDARTVIIAGKPGECTKVAQRLGAQMNEIPQGMVGHCDFVKPHCGAIQYVHDMLAVPNLQKDGIQLYTGVGGGKPMPNVSGKALGDHVGNVYSEIADFDRLVRAVHADGHDVFVELGADSHRSNAVKNILKGKKHVAVSIDRRGESLWNQILKMCAVLLSHGININLNNLYHSNSATALKERNRLQRKIVLNGRFGATRPKSPVKSSPNKINKSSNSVSKKFRKKKKYTGPIVYDEKDLLEFAEGDISKVFGPKFKEIDQYARRVRLPMSEYLLCTRVTHVRGVDLENYVPCQYKKCSMVTEYDIPINGPHSEGGDVPWAILVESGQCDLMLISLLGVDFECKSERVYRLLDTTLTFYGIAKEGDTLVYDIQIDSFAKRPDGKGLSMFFFRYNCYVNGKLLIEMRNGCAGFFSDEELAAGKGIVYTKAVLDKRAKIKKKNVTPFLIETAKKTSFSQQDMIGLVNCRWGDVVGPTARELNYKLVARKMLMIDQVTHIIPNGGAHGLGLIIGEKFLERDHWYFPCHFKGDQVMAGSLVSDGCSQMLKLYMVWLGLHKTVNNLIFRPVNGQPNKVRCRGQIPPHKGKLIYVMEIREMGFDEKTGYPYCVADVDIIDVNHEMGQRWNYAELSQYGRGDMSKKIVVDFKGIALQIEGEPTSRNPIRGSKAIPRAPSTQRASVPARSVAQSSFVSRPGRRAPKPIQPPRGSLKTDRNPPRALTWHPLAGKNGNPTPYFDPTAYPPRAITFIPFPNNPNDTNHVPGELPLSWVNMCEFMCGRTSACLGPEFSRFDNSKTSRSPAFDLQVVTRVLSVTNLERGSFKFKRYTSDINPSKGTMVAQFDVPEDAWFFKANSSDDLMPYSILMEIGLQTSGILTSWVKAPLTMDKDDILFRNLDATAELLKHVDLRGKTITNTSHVVSYAMLGDMGVHKFTFELSVEGEGVFYKGETSFGWFVPEVFEKQVGLDGGVKRDPWHLVEGKGKTQGLVKYDMTNASDRRRLMSKASGEQLLRRSLQVEFLDSIQLIPSSGKYGKGYLHGHKDVNKQDWFFSCHFWCDPVMPGSLGIESMYQMIETFCIHSGIGNGMKKRRFEHDLGKVSWKYRGQLTPKNDTMDAEIHIKSVSNVNGEIVVLADGALYVDSLRVYTATDLRLKVKEAGVQFSTLPASRSKPTTKGGSKIIRKKKKYTGPIVYDEKDLLEFAEGDISKVFGPKFKEIDQYARRVRLPMSEYLLCTRVTHVRGVDLENYVPCQYKKCSMVTEYDIPINGPHSEGGDVPWAILVESGQCDLMLISLLGVDFECKSERVYRLLDTTLTFYGIAKEGDTLVYDIQIDSFAKRPDGKGLSMFFFRYNCYVNGKLLIEMRNGCAGFFSDEELAAGKGIVYTKAVLDKRAKIKKKNVTPFLIETAKKTSFSQQDMIGLVNCRWGDVVGPTARELNYKLVARKMLMIDQVTHIIPNGGAHGLGLIIGEKFLERDHWYFPCHFKGDQVMAGSLVSDGCSQMLKLYMVWLGLHKTVNNLIFRPVNGQPNKVRCRGQIPPHKGKLIYVMEIREMGFDEKTGYPYCVADVDIIDVNHEMGQRWNYAELSQYGRGDMSKKIVVDFKGIALQIEGEPTSRNPIRGSKAIPRAPSTQRASVPARSVAQSSFVSRPGRRAPKPIQPPRGSLKTDRNPPRALTWHPLAGKNGNPTPYFDPTAYPPRAITFIPFPNNPNDTNHVPGELPLSWVNMCEFMCGRTSACLGPEFSRFDNSKTSRSPAFDLQVVTRVLSVTNLERGSFKFKRYTSDINPSKGTMVAQFDVPEDAWFFKANSSDDLMPYSILMEIGLQTSGILTSWVKAPLTMDKDDILFRNLDATAELLKHVDLRGKTITNTSHVVSYAMLGDMGVHKFTFELSVEGEGVFYKGETSFGWFVPEVFEKQVGLDGGVKRDPWHLVEGKGKTQGLVKYDMTNASDRRRLMSKASGEQLLRRSLQVEFLDSIQLIPSSGKYGKGYLHGHKDVNKQDWFFSCHFWCDPVMPGSLGIESMYQMIETFCIHSGIGNGMKKRRFEHDLGKVSWKYRGQLTPKNDTMDAEIHIKSILSVGGDIVVLADGALYVDSLRVYTATDLRLKVQEVGTGVKQSLSKVSRSVPSRPLVRKTVRDTASVQRPRSCGTSLKDALLNLDKPLYINYSNPSEFTHEEPPMELFREYAEIHASTPTTMGDPGFMELYGVDYPLYTGAMAKGIASADLVIALGKRKILGSLGAGGLPLHLVNEALDKIQAELPNGPYAVNLIHSPFDVSLERGNVDLFLKRGVTIAEASAFMSLTEHVVRYRVAGLSMKNGKVHKKNKIIAKCSRTELAEMFMRPAPDKFLKKLLANGEITAEQAKLAKLVPMSDDIAVESDSGGHTDNRPIHVILPLIMALRDRLQKELKYPTPVRVGVGGGIGCPAAMAAAFQMGAAFIITGSVNQIARQSGSSDIVRKELAKAAYSDVTMAPAADMFDQGVKLQVLKKGTMFASRAHKLWDLFCKYNSLDEIPQKDRERLEKKTFKQSIDAVWKETTNFYINRLHDEEKIKRAQNDPKLKMSLCFRWYLSKSSGWANRGEKDRKLDFQVWCGPAMGAYNDFVKGSYLDPHVTGVYPDAVQINLQLLNGCGFINRIQQIRSHPKLRNGVLNVDAISTYIPTKEI